MHSSHSSLCHDNMFIYSRRISFGCEASLDDVIVLMMSLFWKVLEILKLYKELADSRRGLIRMI